MLMASTVEIATVFIVDDDPAMRSAMSSLVRSVGLAVETYQSAQAFLDDRDRDRPGCLVLDVRMPGMSGLELQDLLLERNVRLPLIMVTGYGNVPMAVRALKAGAVAFLEKPFNDQELLDAIHNAIEIDRDRRRLDDLSAVQQQWQRRLARLTPVEYEIMDLILEGKTNKTIATALDMSSKAIEMIRASIMAKLRDR